MKKILLTLSVGALLALSNMQTYVTKAEEKVPTLKEEVYYQEDFNFLEPGTDGYDIHQFTGLLWTSDTIYSEINEENEVEYLVQDVDAGGYSKIGAIGSNLTNNLENLIPGHRYTFSIKVDFKESNDNSSIFFEYINTEWTGIQLFKNGQVKMLGNASNGKYANGILSFDFVATGKSLVAAEGSDPITPYIKLTGQNFSVGDSFTFDDIKIARNRKNVALNNDFENLQVDSVIGNTNNFWNNSMTSIKVGGDEENKYAVLTKNGTEGVEQWGEFYLNQLAILDNTPCRLTFDIIDTDGFDEFYLRYNDNVQECVTFNKTEMVNLPEYQYFKGASFDGTHVTYDFIPSSSVNANFWNQVYIVVRNQGTIEFKIDNINLEVIDDNSNITFDADDFSCLLNDEDYAYGVSCWLDYGNDDIRYLSSEEVIITSDTLDLTKVGEYDVTLTAIDEYLNEYTKDVKLSVIDGVVQDEITESEKTVYKYGEEFDIEGYSFKLIYASGKEETITLTTDNLEGYNKNQLGEQEVTISYIDDNMSYSLTFNVEVVDYVQDITITNPTKTVYEIGESLSLAGLKVNATMASGTTNELRSSDYSVSSFDSSTAGIKTITVTYGEVSKTFEVTVNAKKEDPSDTSSSSSESSSSKSSESSSSSKQEENPTAKKGCGGATIPSILGLISIAGALLISKKRK